MSAGLMAKQDGVKVPVLVWAIVPLIKEMIMITVVDTAYLVLHIEMLM